MDEEATGSATRGAPSYATTSLDPDPTSADGASVLLPAPLSPTIHPTAPLSAISPLASSLSVSTFVNVADLSFKMCHKPRERALLRPAQRESDPHPRIPYSQAGVSLPVEAMGMRLPGRQIPPIMRRDRHKWDAWDRKRLGEHVDWMESIPLQEKMWCFEMLNFTVKEVRAYLKEMLVALFDTPWEAAEALASPGAKALAPTGCDSEHAHPGHTNIPILGDTAFSVAIHLPTDSQLARYFWFVRYRGSNFAEPDVQEDSDVVTQWHLDSRPSTWAFEVFSGKQWDEALTKSREEGPEGARQLLRGARAAFYKLSKRIEKAREWTLERASEALPDLPLAALDLEPRAPIQGVRSTRGSYKEDHDDEEHGKGEKHSDDHSKQALLCRSDARDHPEAVVNRLGDYRPAFALVRGRVRKKMSSTNTTAPLADGDQAHAHSDAEDDGGTTPRAGTPVPLEKPPSEALQ